MQFLWYDFLRCWLLCCISTLGQDLIFCPITQLDQKHEFEVKIWIFCGKIQIFQEFYFLNFWTKIGLLHQCASQLHDFWSPFQSFLGLQSTSPTPLSLWRDSQTVQAYLGTNTITKLPSPSSWANRTAASFALSQSYSSGQKSSQNQPQDKEEIMELKRQLAHATQDLHLTKVNLLPP